MIEGNGKEEKGTVQLISKILIRLCALTETNVKHRKIFGDEFRANFNWKGIEQFIMCLRSLD